MPSCVPKKSPFGANRSSVPEQNNDFALWIHVAIFMPFVGHATYVDFNVWTVLSFVCMM